MELRRLGRLGQIPHVPIYVDSPMALEALQLYREAIHAESPEVRRLPMDADPFDTGDLHEMRTVEESKTLNGPRWPSVIISASGMASGGRVLHHLEGLLPDPRNTVLMVGYQAVSTRGRDLVDGAKSVKIHGRYVPVRADVVDAASFSVHADADEILAWLSQAPRPPQTCYLVHGEPRASATLRDRIESELGWTAVVPAQDERVLIG
jgi:metallo-beta-lactamase family protein